MNKNNDMRYKYLFFFLIFSTITLPILSQAQNFVRERIYLQTDKQVYMAGEMIWMKLLTTFPDGAPVSFSKIAYVELFDESASQARVKVDLIHGIGDGWMIVPISLSSGYYRIVAYTNNMRNEGNEIFFEKKIIVVNLLSTQSSDSISDGNNITESETPDSNTFSLSTDKQSYLKREAVLLKLENLPKDVYTLSISVSGIDPVNIVGERNIIKWQKELPILKTPTFTGNFMPEYEGHIIQGKLINIETGKQESTDGVQSFIAFRGIHPMLFPGDVKKDGSVRFFTNHTAGIKEVISTAVMMAPDVDKKYRIDIDYPFVKEYKSEKLPLLGLSSENKELFLKRNVAIQVLHSYMSDSINHLDPTTSYFNWEPDHSYKMEEYARFATMQEVITEFVDFTRFRNNNGKRYLSTYDDVTRTFSRGSTLVFIDGVPIFDHDVVYNYDPSLLKRIDIYRDTFLFGTLQVKGIIFFTTLKGTYPGLKLDESVQFFDYDGTQPKRYFYSPVYQNEEDRKSRLPDFRHTLLWNPDVKTNGKSSLSVQFFTSDFVNKYKITVEGLTKTGEVIYATSKFEVE